MLCVAELFLGIVGARFPLILKNMDAWPTATGRSLTFANASYLVLLQQYFHATIATFKSHFGTFEGCRFSRISTAFYRPIKSAGFESLVRCGISAGPHPCLSTANRAYW